MIIFLGVLAFLFAIFLMGSKEPSERNSYMWCFIVDVIALVVVYILR